MKSRLLGVCALSGALLVSSSRLLAEEDRRSDEGVGTKYRLLTSIGLPGGPGGFDISWVDQHTGRYYLADSGNAASSPVVNPNIDVVDVRHLRYLYSIPMPSAPHGVLTLHRMGRDDDEETTGELWTALTDSTLRVVSLNNPFASPYTIQRVEPSGQTNWPTTR